MPTNDSSRSRSVVAGAAIVCLVLAVVAAASVYQASQLRGELQQASAEIERLKTPSKSSDAASADDTALLRKVLQDKEDAYVQLQAEYERLKSQSATASAPGAVETVAESAAVVTGGASAPMAAANARVVTWLERLKTQDPARYQQVQQDRERRRQQVAAPFTEQYDRVDEQLIAAQTQDEATMLNQLAETLAKASDLRNQWQAIRDLPEPQRREQSQQLMAESRDTYQQLVDLQGKNRQLQLQQLATQVGYNDPKVAGQFVDSVNQIVNQTDTSWNRVMGFGGRGGPRGTPSGGATPGPTTTPTTQPQPTR